MIRFYLRMALATLIVAGPRTARAQSIPDLNAPRRAAQKAADATDARTSAQTGQAVPVRRGATPTPPKSGPVSPQQSKGAPALSGGTGTTAQGTPAPPPAGIVPVTREVYSYENDSRRDPFYSLILTEDLRPLLSDLKLVGILFSPVSSRSVAIMRDIVTNAQYRVNAGMTLGRMRVAQIKPRAVIFTVDEFGLSRQDSLFLADTSKTRIR